MTELTDEVLDRVCEVARLKVSASDKKMLRKDLENILKTFSEIQQIEVSDEELFYVVDNVNPFREDKAPSFCDPEEAKCSEKELIMDNVPHKKDGKIKVPRSL